MNGIVAYCRITGESVSVNGKLILHYNPLSDHSWSKQIYHHIGLDYPKFYKMDRLSQFGVLGSELVKGVSNNATSGYQDDEVALLFANSESSADTDRRFEGSYLTGGAPSPSLFVYTLPNIVMGEIAIRNKWYGENMFAVFPKFAADFFVNYSSILIKKGSMAVMAGWVSLERNEVDVLVFLVENDKEGFYSLTSENLTDLYRAK